MIVGTAGHIDHGKTALVKALTGVDGDRLKEEKARGITIDLGFAYLPTPTERILGFIDVPGHERFVHTMLAGASGIDFALLTVAADDGIKPQTAEHLAILDLLGIDRGIIALTKADLVTPDRLVAVTAQIAAAITGTALAGADILPVSALTGRGIDDLRRHLIDAATQTRSRSSDGRFRLAVDRVSRWRASAWSSPEPCFPVLSTWGIMSSEPFRPDGPGALAACPEQACWRPVVQAIRCALNLTGPDISRDAIRRGDVVVDPEICMRRPIASMRSCACCRTLAKPIGQWFPVRLHHAAPRLGRALSCSTTVRFRPAPRPTSNWCLTGRSPRRCRTAIVVRDVSAQHTLGGGTFIDLRPPARRRRTPERRAQRAALASQRSACRVRRAAGSPTLRLGSHQLRARSRPWN